MGKKEYTFSCDIFNVDEQKTRLFKKIRYFFGMKVVWNVIVRWVGAYDTSD